MTERKKNILHGLGISIAHMGYTPPAYMYSATLISTLFWATGCAIGITAGGLVPLRAFPCGCHLLRYSFFDDMTA